MASPAMQKGRCGQLGTLPSQAHFVQTETPAPERALWQLANRRTYWRGIFLPIAHEYLATLAR